MTRRFFRRFAAGLIVGLLAWAAGSLVVGTSAGRVGRSSLGASQPAERVAAAERFSAPEPSRWAPRETPVVRTDMRRSPAGGLLTVGESSAVPGTARPSAARVLNQARAIGTADAYVGALVAPHGGALVAPHAGAYAVPSVGVYAAPYAPATPRNLAVPLDEVVASSAPRALVTVMVDIPDALQDAAEVSFEVRTKGVIQVLGRLAGVARVPGETSRPVVLTLRVPADADAGRLAAADVVFRARDGRQFVIPVVLEVPLVRAVAIAGAREMRGLRTGDRVELAYRVTNSGNAPDTVIVAATAPAGWTVHVPREERLVLPARATVEVYVRVFVPLSTNMGDHTLVVSILGAADDEPLDLVRTTLGVIGQSGQVAGLVFIPSIAVAASSEGSATSTSAVLEGPVANGVYLRAQVSPSVARGGPTMQGLASVGAMTAPFAASLSSERWHLSAGNTGQQLSDLTGVNIMGQGVSGELRTDRHSARAIVARPAAGRSSRGGLVGAGVWRETTRGRVGAQISSLSARGGYSGARELTAVGVDYRSPMLRTVRLGAAVAHRAIADATGVGFALTASHERARDRASLRVTHAPGGTAAFARAVDEFQVDAGRVLTDRWSMDVNALHSHDAGAVFSSTDVTSWSVGNRYDLRPDVALNLRGQSSRFTARSAGSTIGAFGAAERSLTGGAEWRRGLVSISAEGSVGVVSRSSELLGGRMYETSATQRGIRLGASRMFDQWGALTANASLESTAEGVGLPGNMLAASVRWAGIPVVLAGRPMRLGTEASYQRLGNMQRSLVTRATLDVGLPFGLDMRMSAERNPFYRNAAGRAGWIAAVRISAAGRVYTPKALGPEGVVFEDRNLNGRRDADEPGVDGVIVRRGDAKASTDDAGRYRLPIQARGRTRIDQGTLPLGLVAHPMLSADTLERLDLPVLPTGTVTVQLVLVPDERGRVPEVDLLPAIVFLRDERGFEWVGRRTSPTTARFEGVPSGAYTLHFNFDRLSEALRAEESVPVVVEPHAEHTMSVPLRARAVRLFTPDPSRHRR